MFSFTCGSNVLKALLVKFVFCSILFVLLAARRIFLYSDAPNKGINQEPWINFFSFHERTFIFLNYIKLLYK